MEALPIKCVVVGDGAVGKTDLLKTYVYNKYPSEYVPTTLNYYETSVTVDGKVHPLTLWDTSGLSDYDRLRPLSYPATNVLVLCFSIDYRESFLNIRQKWIKEVSFYCTDVPIILVGTKTDLRPEKAGATDISSAEGHRLAESIGAACYLECSAKQLTGVKEVFETAARTYLSSISVKVKENRQNCNLM